jgi:hypothetical protein
MALTQVRPEGLGFVNGRRNLIINGAMQVAQRGTSETGQTGGGYKTCDRFQFGISGIGTYTITQSTDAPDGFANSLKVDCTTADASPTGSDRLFVSSAIEGQDVQHLKKGTSAAEQLTLSFWVKSNKTGVGNVNLRDADNTRMVGGTYTINTANTWEYKTVTYPADTTGVLDNDNAASLRVEWWLDSGSNYNSGTTPTAWEAESSTDFNASGTLDIADSTSNDWHITGVQLEVGTNASDFEHRSFGEELALCQRYFTRVPTIDGSTAYTFIAAGMATDTTESIYPISYPVTMRANPSLTTSGSMRVYNGGTVNPSAGITLNSVSTYSASVSVPTGSVLTTKDAVLVGLNNDVDANFQFDAEL